MNCSQKLISLIFGTTLYVKHNETNVLWIALKSWYLWYSEQQHSLLYYPVVCCELLSKVDIFDIWNNTPDKQLKPKDVVNCSQKLISLIFGTTHQDTANVLGVLWIALKSWYLWYSEQQSGLRRWGCHRCELLSKVDIFDIRNNWSYVYFILVCVVNCSQKLISLIFGTTLNANFSGQMSLWIALKSWYLWYSEQHAIHKCVTITCCELLSKVDIFDIRNN